MTTYVGLYLFVWSEHCQPGQQNRLTKDATEIDPPTVGYSCVRTTWVPGLCPNPNAYSFISTHIPIVYFLQVVLFPHIKINYRRHLSKIMATRGFKLESHFTTIGKKFLGKMNLCFKRFLSTSISRKLCMIFNSFINVLKERKI